MKRDNKAALEELAMLSEYLANTAACITTAMFDSDLEPGDCENAMRYFTENLIAFSSQMKAALLEAAYSETAA